MTADELPGFVAVLADLCASRRRPIDDTESRALFRLLNDLSWRDVERGLHHSARHDRWFPDAVAIRKAVDKSAGQAQTIAITPEALAALSACETHCLACDDTGWEILTRPSPLAGTVEHADSTRSYARPCRCRPTNPLYQAKRCMERRSTAREEGPA